MAVVRGEFGKRRGHRGGWARYEAQEPEGHTPDVEQPPDADLPELNPEYPNAPAAPPFTGEDVEDAGEPTRNPDRPLPM
jgi:hypothetical protein